MAGDTNTYQRILSEIFRRADALLDAKDYYAAISGVDIGRQRRHTSGNDENSLEARREKQHQRFMDLLTQWLSDPEYAKLFKESENLLDEAQALTDKVLAKLRNRLAMEEQVLKDALENASKLRGGEAVFLDEHGRGRTLEGRVLTQEEFDSVVWKKDGLTYAEIQSIHKAPQTTAEQIADIERKEVTLIGDMRGRMHDRENPVSAEKHREFQEEIKDHIESLQKIEATPVIPSADTSASLPRPSL